MANDRQTQSQWKIQLTIQMKFIHLIEKILKKLVLCIPRAAI